MVGQSQDHINKTIFRDDRSSDIETQFAFFKIRTGVNCQNRAARGKAQGYRFLHIGKEAVIVLMKQNALFVCIAVDSASDIHLQFCGDLFQSEIRKRNLVIKGIAPAVAFCGRLPFPIPADIDQICVIAGIDAVQRKLIIFSGGFPRQCNGKIHTVITEYLAVFCMFLLSQLYRLPRGMIATNQQIQISSMFSNGETGHIHGG